MLHNLSIAVTSQSMLVLIWEDGFRHNAYWELVMWKEGREFPCRFLDGPFANQFMAGMDIYQRCMDIKWIEWRNKEGKLADPRAHWGLHFGINFKHALGTPAGERSKDELVVHEIFEERPGSPLINPLTGTPHPNNG